MLKPAYHIEETSTQIKTKEKIVCPRVLGTPPKLER